MSIFKKLNAEKKIPARMPIEPIDLYSRLKRDEKYFHLRGIQEEALNIWHNNRANTHNVIKMNTGSGKTLVGLLMLYSKMIETGERSLFLCPDKQLVSQVLEQSKNYHIPTCAFEDREFPEDFLNNKAILVTTVQKLFNSRNIFDKERTKIGSILFDDAHKCVEKIFDQFTLKIPKDSDLYCSLFSLFEDEIRKQEPGSFEGITTNMPVYYCKVPFWTWNDQKEAVINILRIGKGDNFLFNWDFFINSYHNYEVYIDRNGIEITPIKCNTRAIDSYFNCPNKFAMSATFENDSALLYHLDFNAESISSPIEPKSRNDYGQRLILSPRRYFPQFVRDHLKSIMKHHLSNEENILVIVPSYKYAEHWKQEHGAEILSEEIEEKLASLKTSKGNLCVIVNRYDGIDLSGDMCNILILHDYPTHQYLSDRYRANFLFENGSNLVAQTIEQGLGRTVRAGSDYSVVYLVGDDMLKFLRNRENFDSLNKHTKRQMEIGIDLLKDYELGDDDTIESIICQTADSCLNQTQEWLDYYQDEMLRVVHVDKDDATKEKLQLKELERDAISAFIIENYSIAAKLLDQLLNSRITDKQKSMYLVLAANVNYFINKNTSNDLLIKAKKLNDRSFQPFLSKEYMKTLIKSKHQLQESLNFLRSFTDLNDYINYVRETIGLLRYSPDCSSDKFELGVKNLGLLLGYQSFRPEKEMNEGPDNIWIQDNKQCLIIECKSEKKLQNGINKEDISQLYHSIEWFKNRYFHKDIVIYGITMQNNNKKEKSVVATEDLKILDGHSLSKIKENLDKYINFLSKKRYITEVTEHELSAEFYTFGFDTVSIGKYFRQIK